MRCIGQRADDPLSETNERASGRRADAGGRKLDGVDGDSAAAARAARGYAARAAREHGARAPREHGAATGRRRSTTSAATATATRAVLRATCGLDRRPRRAA